ncbi:MAG: N-acetylneuraminate synthase family protein, partial [Verrucomicrobia bacterium]|nr:N-acetylneuraminate synthase family protein [Verrucomicrobiota bacterium]
EITKALKALDNIQKRKITLLHATTSYPCPADETNLRAIQTLIKKFKIPVGFSDHTNGTEAAISAVALGACVVEKHLTLNKNDIGPDHKASLEPAEFKAMVKGIRFVEKALGTGIKKPTASEKKIKEYIEKKVFCACRIMKKTKIYEKHLKFKRGATGLVVSKLNKILGKKILRNKQENEPIYFKDFYKKI